MAGPWMIPAAGAAIGAMTNRQQAAMLAAQNTGFGLPGVMATGQAAASAPGLGLGLTPAFQQMQYGLANKLTNPSSLAKLGGNMMQQPQQQPMSAPPAPRPLNVNAGGPIQAPQSVQRRSTVPTTQTLGAAVTRPYSPSGMPSPYDMGMQSSHNYVDMYPYRWY
jgi:hypothetical protein